MNELFDKLMKPNWGFWLWKFKSNVGDYFDSIDDTIYKLFFLSQLFLFFLGPLFLMGILEFHKISIFILCNFGFFLFSMMSFVMEINNDWPKYYFAVVFLLNLFMISFVVAVILTILGYRYHDKSNNIREFILKDDYNLNEENYYTIAAFADSIFLVR